MKKAYNYFLTTEIDVFSHAKVHPGMYIATPNTNGFLNLLSYLLDKLKSLKKEINYHLTILGKNEFSVKINNANFDSLINLIHSTTQDCVYDLRTFMAFTESSFITIKKREKTYLIESNESFDENYKIKTLDTKNNKEEIVINFKLDTNIFKNFELNIQLIREKLTQFAMLNPHIKIHFKNKINFNTKELFYFPKGISEKLELEVLKQENTIPLFTFDKKVIINGYSYHIAFCYLDHCGRTYIKTFALNRYLYQKGSLEEGVISGIKKILQEKGINIKITDKKIKEKLVLIAQIKSTKKLNFSGCVKAGLNMPEMKKDISKYVKNELNEYFNQNPDILKKLLERINHNI